MSKANISVMTLTVTAAANVAENRFVKTDGTYATAGGLPLGVTRCDASTGESIPVDVLGTTVVEAGAAIALDAVLMIMANGKVVTHDGDGDKHAVGRALEAASGDGRCIEILLIPASGLLVTAA